MTNSKQLLEQFFVLMTLKGISYKQLGQVTDIGTTALVRWANYKDSCNLHSLCKCYNAIGYELVPMPIEGYVEIEPEKPSYSFRDRPRGARGRWRKKNEC